MHIHMRGCRHVYNCDSIMYQYPLVLNRLVARFQPYFDRCWVKSFEREREREREREIGAVDLCAEPTGLMGLGF